MKSVFINSSPNSQVDDVVLAFKKLISFWNWNKQNSALEFEEKISKDFGVDAVGFDSARSSFYAILKSWNIGPGDEVIVPAFTCTVIVNPILWVGAKPLYVDIDKNTLNVEFDELKSKITPNTKVILAQHTFGKPLEIEQLVGYAHEKGIKVVEDCAHTLGLKRGGKHLGTFGDAAVITFGMTKVISGVRGGMALTSDKSLVQNLFKFRAGLPNFSFTKNLKFLLNPIIWFFIQPVYYLGYKKFTVGKLVILILQKLGIVSINNIVEQCEELGMRPNWIPAKPSPALFDLAHKQYNKLPKLNSHRVKLAKIYSRKLGFEYEENHLYLRVGVYVKDKRAVLEYFRTKGIILGDWYKSILHIPEQNYGRLHYQKGECPNAEFAAKHLVNLPTFAKVSEDQASQIAEEFLENDFLIQS